jgi:shikimate kinase
MTDNIVLIGMPGAGKSTVGVVLAKTLGYDFIDTDILLSRRLGMTLQAYIDTEGLDSFLKAEEETALGLRCDDTVIATGGSMVLSDRAMTRLKQDSTVVFIDVPLPELTNRLANITTRGIALRPGQTLDGLYRERRPLYLKYADFTVPNSGERADTLEAVVTAIAARVGRPGI